MDGFERLFKPPSLLARVFPARRHTQIYLFIRERIGPAVFRLCETLNLKDGDRFVVLPIHHIAGMVFEIRDPVSRVAMRLNIQNSQIFISVSVMNAAGY